MKKFLCSFILSLCLCTLNATVIEIKTKYDITYYINTKNIVYIKKIVEKNKCWYELVLNSVNSYSKSESIYLDERTAMYVVKILETEK